MANCLCNSFLYVDTDASLHLFSFLTLTAKAAGDRAGAEMAEDGAKMGEVQEQRQGEIQL